MWLRETIKGCSLAIALLMMGCGPVSPNAKAIEQELARAIPLRSNPKQVLEYLNEQRIEHSDYQRDGDRGYSIKAVVRDQSKWSIVKTDCGIAFRFDNDGHLLAYKVLERYTGP
jgi:hypothetical protein